MPSLVSRSQLHVSFHLRLQRNSACWFTPLLLLIFQSDKHGIRRALSSDYNQISRNDKIRSLQCCLFICVLMFPLLLQSQRKQVEIEETLDNCSCNQFITPNNWIYFSINSFACEQWKERLTPLLSPTKKKELQSPLWSFGLLVIEGLSLGLGHDSTKIWSKLLFSTTGKFPARCVIDPVTVVRSPVFLNF